jgi:hypothetical protein
VIPFIDRNFTGGVTTGRTMDVITAQDDEFPRTLSVGVPNQTEPLLPQEWSERFQPLSEERQQQVLSRLMPKKPARRVEPKPKTPHTYLVGAEGSPLVKIGYTSGAPLKRLASLQTGQPMTLSLLWSLPVDIENELHERFAAYRVRGEWFDLTPLGDAVEVVQAAAEQVSSTS